MSQNMTLRLFLPVVVLAVFFNTAKCQNGEAWTMRVEVTNNDVCAPGRSFAGSNTSITYGGVTQNSSDGTTFFSASFADADGIFSDNPLETTDDVLITTSVDCFCSNPMVCAFGSITTQTINGNIPVNHIPSDGNCRTILQTIGSDKVSVVITFIKTMNQPTVDPPNSITGFCENSTLALSTTSTASASGYKWYVAESTGSTYHEITGKTTQTINVNANDLNKTGFTTATRKIRVEDASCGGSSAPSNQFTIYLAPPTSASIAWADPSCFGEDNGTVTINSVTGSVSNYLFTLEYDDGTGYHAVYQEAFATSALPVTIDKATIISDGLVSFGIKAGSWRLHTANNSSTSTLGSCFISEDKTIGQPSLLTAMLTNVNNLSYNGKGVKCNGDTNGSISVSASGGNPGGYTYLWSNSSTGTSISNLAAGTYSITVTDSKGCTSSPTLALDPPDPLALSITTTKTPSCNESADGQLTAIPVGGVSPYTYLWSNSQTNSLATGFAKGIHSVTVTDNNGCTINTNNDLGAPAAIVVLIDGTPPTCANGDNGRVWVTDVQNEPSATLQYSWDTGDDTYEALNLSQGTYTVTVTSPNGGVNCTGTANKTIVDPPGRSATINPVLAYNGAAISCTGQSNGRLDVTLRNHLDQVVSGEYFTWSTGANGPSVNYIDQLAEGMYSVTVLYNGICEATASYNLNDPDPVSAIVTISSNYNDVAITCPGASDGSLHAVGGGGTGSSYTFAWSTGTTGPDLTGRPAGNYTVIATDVNGCTGSGGGVLNDPPMIVPNISIISNYNGQSIKCHNGQDAKLRATATGGAGGYTYSWDTGTSGADLNDIGAGTYTVTVTDANSCTQPTFQTLINPTPVTGSIIIKSDYQGQAIKCHNESNGVLEASGAGGAGTYSYLWNTGATTKTLSGIGASTYSVTVKDINQCSSALVGETLSNPDPVTTEISVTSDYHGTIISCDGASDGSLSASATGGTQVFTYTWNTGDSGADLAGLPKGTYEVTASDQNGCFGKKNISLDDPDLVVASIVAISDYNGYGVKCEGDHNGFMEAAGAGGTGTYSFAWLNTSELTYRLADIGEGIYTVTVTDVNGCHDDASDDIIEPTVLSLSAIQKIDPKCFDGNDGAITVLATGGTGVYEYERDLLSWQVLSQFSGLRATTQYIFKAKDENGCITSISESLSQPTEIIISFTDVEPAFCADPRGKATGVVSGGTGSNYTYQWQDVNNLIFDTDAIIENRSAGAYTLTIHDENDCSTANSIGIVSTDGPVAEVDEMIPAKCSYSSDGSATLKVITGNSPYTFAWPDGQTTIQGKNLAEGSHIVTITDTYGCLSVKEVIVEAPDELSINLIEATIPSCSGYSDGKLKVEGVGGTTNYIFSWGGFIGDEVSGLTKGNHMVQVVDANGCQAVNTFALDEPTPLEINLVQKQLPSCNGNSDGSIEVAASGANGNYHYAWSNQTEAKVIDICAGDYNVSVTDSMGCVLQKSYNLGQPEILQAKLVKNTRPSCYAGCDGGLEIEAFGGNGNYSYAWVEGSLSSVIQNICSGEHLVTITDAKGCELKDKSFVLDQPEAVQARIVKELMPSCNGDCNGSLQIEGYGGSGGYQYTWSNGTVSATLNNICAGNQIVTVTDQKSCVLKDKTLTLTQPDILQLQLEHMTPPTCNDGCDGKLLTEAIGGNGGYQYTWSTGTKNALAEDLCVQEYGVMVVDAKACLASANYSVGNTPQLVVELGDPLTLCVGQKHVLDAGDQWTTYKWTSNTGLTANTQRVTIQEAGLYQVDVINSDGCTAKGDFVLETSTDLLNAEFFMTANAVVGDTVVMVDVSWPLPENIIWNYPSSMVKIFDNGPVVHGQFNEAGKYEITLSASLGECRDKMAKTITILKTSENPDGGRLGYKKFVTQFELYPNPNDGEFDVSIELAEESPITLSVWSLKTSLNMGTWKDNGKSSYLKHIDLRPLGSGIYVLRFDHAKGYELIRFIVH